MANMYSDIGSMMERKEQEVVADMASGAKAALKHAMNMTLWGMGDKERKTVAKAFRKLETLFNEEFFGEEG